AVSSAAATESLRGARPATTATGMAKAAAISRAPGVNPAAMASWRGPRPAMMGSATVWARDCASPPVQIYNAAATAWPKGPRHVTMGKTMVPATACAWTTAAGYRTVAMG